MTPWRRRTGRAQRDHSQTDPTGEANRGALRLDFDRRLLLQFRGSAITSDAGLLPYRELDDAVGLTDTAANTLADSRTGKNIRHLLGGLLRQSACRLIVTNLSRPAERIVAFYNQRGTCEQWIKEGKGAIKWTRLSCRSFAANAVRLQLHALAYNLGNFMRTLATPELIKDWSLTSLKEKLIQIGAKVVSHGRYVAFQMAEVAVPKVLFADILRLIAELRPPPVTSTA